MGLTEYSFSFLRTVSTAFLAFVSLSLPSNGSDESLTVPVNTGPAHEIYEDDGGTLWILADNGLFAKSPRDSEPRADQRFGNTRPYAIYEDKRKTLWVSTADGLVHDGRRYTNIDMAMSFHEDKAGVLWIASFNGLFRKDKEVDDPVEVIFDTWKHSTLGVVATRTFLPRTFEIFENQAKRAENDNKRIVILRSYVDSTKTLWIATSKGLYRKDDGATTPVNTEEYLSAILAFGEEANGTLWISAENGLFRRPSGMHRLDLVHKPPSTVATPDNAPIDGTGSASHPSLAPPYRIHATSPHCILFASSDGVTFISQADPRLRAISGPREHVRVIHVCRRAKAWIGTTNALYVTPPFDSNVRQSDMTAFEVKGVNDGVFAIHEDRNGTLWIGTASGVFRIARNADVGAEAIAKSNMVLDIHEDNTGSLWIASHDGISRIGSPNANWGAKITLTSKFPQHITMDTTLSMAWTIGNYENRSSPQTVPTRISIFAKTSTGHAVKQFSIPKATFEFTFNPQLDLPMRPGNYFVVIEAEDWHGKVATSEKYSFTVEGSLEERIVSAVKAIIVGLSLVYAIVNVAMCVVLVIGARWSHRCLQILTDPTVCKLGIYYRYILWPHFVRIWVLERYFQKVKAGLHRDHGYVERSLRRDDLNGIPTSQLLSVLRVQTHCWVGGGPGTGKSEMIAMLMFRYFSHDSLRAAWNEFQFIAVPVPLRRITEKTVPEIVRQAMQLYEAPLGDLEYFGSLFPHAEFLVVVDGFNEVGLDEGVLHNVPASVRILVTSQERPHRPDNQFEILELSRVTPDFAKDLLCSFVPSEQSEQVIAKVTKGLWEEIDSAYDVRLIADLIREEQPIPGNTLTLSKAVFDCAVARYSGQYPKQIVCEVAWNLWKFGKRRFKADEKLTAELLTPLLTFSIVVNRGDYFEFRHDLMRGFLAAYWSVEYAASLHVTIERLNEKEIWNLSPADQESVFSYVTRLVETKNSLTEVANFAAEEPRTRAILLECCKKAARKRRWGSLDIKMVVDQSVGTGSTPP